ncbi:MAG: ABC transporter ATP-binding protein [Nitrososphaerota archaeon]|nr:ABC transporter ATP-binding protein [Nitrososphaerota archaeon]
MVEAQNVTKRFGTLYALSGLSLSVKPGEIYGLLGPNGSGKTTTIKIISGILQPDDGRVNVLGIDPASDPVGAKSKIGYVPENPLLYESLTPREFFEFVASVRKMSKTDAQERATKLVKAFDIDQYFDSPIATLSMGTKQKIAVISALIHEPPLLLMDEPLNGLDAKSSRILKELMAYHTEMGGSVLFSTHIMEVAENICTRIGIIYQGRIVAEGTMDELRSYAGGSGTTLEQVFLRLTNEESEIADTIRVLREAFSAARVK